jgi:hypothetical protein
MAKPAIDIVIDEDGMLHLEVNGCEGSSCETLTDTLLQRMGTIEDVQKKPEYYIEQGRPDYIDQGE